jgi:tRNA/tmRNA/rRNA uracil-C5-methylase (TrmA/RlmC/RlmD family)
MSFQVGQEIEVTAGEAAHGGWCVARPDGLPVVFLRHALPGELVRARVTEVTSRFARADAVAVLAASPDRVEPPCQYAHPGGCGGCDWQHATLPAQRALKGAVVAQQLRRMAGIDREIVVEPLPEWGEGEGQREGLGWRTRMRFAVTSDGTAGLRGHRSHEVIPVDDCLIASPAIRDLGIPRSSWPGLTAVEAISGADSAERAMILEGQSIRERRGKTGGDTTARSVNAETVLSRRGRTLSPVRGRPYLRQHAAGRDWRVSADAFWQVHPGAADALAEAVLAALRPAAGDTAADLYCGAGLFAGVLAPVVGPGGTVVGVESDAAAVRDARHNLRDFGWARVHRGDVAAVLRRGQLPPARLVVADPPRAGLAREVISYLADGLAERFAYVSCDPATLSRDIRLLVAAGWTLDGLRAFDAFPMTHHVECVATVTR